MKKILTIVISIALIAAICIGGTLAYLTSNADGKTLVNTFVFGSGLSITLNEAKIDPDTGEALTGSTAERVLANNYPIIPGATMDKDPTVTVLKDSEPCYVFAYVTNNATLNSKPVATILDLATSTKWLAVSELPGLYVYSSSGAPVIVPKNAADQPLPSVFTQIRISDELTVPDLSFEPIGTVNVQAFAYQASGDVTYSKARDEAVNQFKTP